MDDSTPDAAQTPASTGLPADLFAKAQAAATEKGRPIYVYRAERAGRFTSKWEPMDGATPAAVIEPLPVADSPAPPALPHDGNAAAPAHVTTSADASDRAPEAPVPSPGVADRVTLYGAGGQTVEWERTTDVQVEDGGRVVRFRDATGAAVRVVVGGGSVSVLTPAPS